MSQAHKAFTMLSAAVTMTMLGTEAAAAGAKSAPDEGQPDRGKVEKKRKQGRAKVKRVKKGRRRPGDHQPDLGMPAGTLYDALRREDVA